MRRNLMLTVVVAAGMLLGLAACTPEQVAIYNAATPEQQQVIVAEVQRQQAQAQATSTDCYAAMRAVWPSSMWSWAEGIIHRESRGYHAADNPSSSASGCFQLLQSLHAHRYTAVGCSPAQWSNALCNVKAAYHLYQSAGTSPWRL
jgi:hypothetical protein